MNYTETHAHFCSKGERFNPTVGCESYLTLEYFYLILLEVLVLALWMRWWKTRI